MLADAPDKAKGDPGPPSGCHTVSDQCMPTAEQAAPLCGDCVLGILGSVVADQQWAGGGLDVPTPELPQRPSPVDRSGATTRLISPPSSQLGVLWAVQRDQDVIGIKIRHGIFEGGH